MSEKLPISEVSEPLFDHPVRLREKDGWKIESNCDEVKLSLNLRRADFPAKHFLRQNEIWCPETLCELTVNWPD